MFYKALGFAVWKGAKWYVMRKAKRRNASREALVATALAIGAAAVNEARR